MLRYVLFDLRLFDSRADTDASRKGLLCLLEGLAMWNQLYLRQHPETPLLYKSGVKYLLPEQFMQASVPQIDVVREALEKAKIKDKQVLSALNDLSSMVGGGEHFRDIPAIIENGGGDCDNVSSWRVAELRQRGILATPYITWKRRPDGGMTYHALVRWPDGTSEDPSLILGMGGADRADDRAEEIRKNAERKQIAIDVLKKKYLTDGKSNDFDPNPGAKFDTEILDTGDGSKVEVDWNTNS